MKICITGSSGYVGQHLINFLKQDSDSNFQVYPISLRNKHQEISNECDVLIHLAAMSEDNSKEINVTEYYDVNVNLVKITFQQFLKSDIKDYIFFSSIKSVADHSNNLLTEDTVTSPVGHYGKSKLEAEKFLLSQELPQGKRLFILRPVAIYGPGTTDNISFLFKLVNLGIPWPFAAFQNKRSFLYIDNLNYVISKLILDKNVSSGIYHIADDEFFSTNEIIKLVAQYSKKNIFFLKIPKFFFTSLAKLGDKIKLPFNTKNLEKLTNSYIVSNQKVKTALNISKLPYSGEEGLYNTIQSFKK